MIQTFVKNKVVYKIVFQYHQIILPEMIHEIDLFYFFVAKSEHSTEEYQILVL